MACLLRVVCLLKSGVFIKSSVFKSGVCIKSGVFIKSVVFIKSDVCLLRVVVPLAMTRTNGPWTYTSNDSYMYQLSLVVATASISLV